MSPSLHAIDLLIGIAYLVGSTLLAIWLSRRQRDIRTFFVGDRDVSWWLILFSIVATETSAVTFLSVPGRAYDPAGGNLNFLQLALGLILGKCVVAALLLPQYLQGEFLSVYELLRQRFNPAVQQVASGIFLLAHTVGDGLRLFLPAIMLNQITGWGMAESIVVMAAVTITYSYLGGITAVLWTDLLQFAIYLGGAIVAASFILGNIDGGWETYFQIGSAASKFTTFDFRLDFGSDNTFWAGIIGGAFLSMATHGADQMMVQRYLCARSLAAARGALLLSGLVIFLQFFLFLLIGVGLYVLQVQGSLPVAEKDRIFTIFIIDQLPVGVVGLVVSAVLAAALTSSLNSAASAFVADFYKPLVKERSEGHYLWVSRLMTLVWGLAQMTVALLAVEVVKNQSIINHVLTVAGFTTGTILGLFLLGRMARPVSSAAALIGLLAGFMAVLCVWILGLQKVVQLAWPWYAPLGSGLTVGVALVVDPLLKRFSK